MSREHSSIRVLIVEDETAATINLTSIIAQVCPQAEIVASLESVVDTVKWLRESPQPDLIFMDIHLADGDAFHIFENFEVLSPVVFTTAYDKYALEAFKVNSIDYLLKPIKASDLSRAIDKFSRLTRSDAGSYVDRTSGMVAKQSNVGAFLIHLGDKIVPVKAEDIAFCYTSQEQVTIYTKNGRTLPYNRSLDVMMERLSGEVFFRANRQFIVSRECISEISVWFGSRLSVTMSLPVPEKIVISKARTPIFKAWMAGEV